MTRVVDDVPPALHEEVQHLQPVRGRDVCQRPFARHAEVMVVGHEPGLSNLASLLLTGSPDAVAIELKKGGLIVLEVEELGSRSPATLRGLLTSKQLRRLR